MYGPPVTTTVLRCVQTIWFEKIDMFLCSHCSLDSCIRKHDVQFILTVGKIKISMVAVLKRSLRTPVHRAQAKASQNESVPVSVACAFFFLTHLN